jgi:hypothetical protein
VDVLIQLEKGEKHLNKNLTGYGVVHVLYMCCTCAVYVQL